MTTYRAWDHKDYPWPPPAGWYQAADELWWPEGYGPGPAPDTPSPASEAPAPAAPAPVAPAPVAPAPEAPSPVEPAGPAPGFADVPVDPTTSLSTDPTTVLPTQPQGMGPPPGAATSSTFDRPDPMPGMSSTPPFGGAGPEPAPGFGPPPGSMPGPAAPSSKKPLLIIVGAVVALLVVGGIAAAVLRSSDDDPGPVAFDAAATPGSAANPHAFGEVVRLTFDDPDSGDPVDWKIQVLSGPTPREGDVVGSTVRLEYVGGAQTPNLDDFELVTIGPDGDRRDRASCPNDLVTNRVPGAGEVVEGDVCWVVPTGDLASTSMIVQVKGVDGEVHLLLQ